MSAVEWPVRAPEWDAGLHDLTNDAYHADPVPDGSLSVSGAKKLLPPWCPAIYRWERDHPVHKDVYDFGSAAHKLVLDDPDAQVIVVNAPDWRTKAAREQRDAARAVGNIPILAGDAYHVQAMAEQIRAHPVAAALLSGPGRAEQSAFWPDARTGIWRRARFDWLPDAGDGRLLLVDYKTAASANPYKFAKAVADYGYHMQADWYLQCATALDLGPDPAFLFIVQEKAAPYVVSVVQLDEDALRIGAELNARALDVYAECVYADVWPGYSTGIDVVSLPGYYQHQHEETL